MDENPYEPPKSDISDPTAEAIKMREAHIGHEASIRAFGLLFYLAGVMFGLGGIGQLILATELLELPLFAMGAGIILLGITYFWIGNGLRQLRSKVRHIAGVFAAIGLLGFPIGTIINGYLLYLLYSKKGKMVFSEEYQEIRAATPDIKSRTSIIIWLLLILVLLMIVAAIVIPALNSTH
jgi:predicted nucleic acid-binding Zn ribbon protein